MAKVTRSEAMGIIAEMDTAIRSSSPGSASLARIISLSSTLRDRVHSERLESEDKEKVLDILRSAKLLALSETEAYRYLEHLDLLESDIKRAMSVV